jgi:CubicO group peptidase (beta-lactamase class C family)
MRFPRITRDRAVRNVAIFVAALTPASTAAQTPPDALAAAVDSVFAFARGDAPGCAVGIARGGRPVLARAYGMADLEQRTRNTPETVFESGSVAKQFTAAALLLLEQDGRLSLDDDVRRYIPELPELGARITLRHLLTHASGLREQWSLLAITGNPPGAQVHSLATVLDLVTRQRALNFAPGEEYLYTNTGYALAALVVERASGRGLAEFTEERLFRPLGMSHTRWRDDFRRVVPGRATGYSVGQGSVFRLDMPFTNVVGNGGMLTTVGDLLRWNAFLDSPSALPGGARLVRALAAPGRLTGGRVLRYGLGLELDSLGGAAVVYHGGSTAGYRTWLGRVPAQGVSVALLCNSAGVNASALGEQITSLLLAPNRARRSTPAPAAASAPADLAGYAGTFWDSRSGMLLHTAVVDGGLVWHAGRPVPLAFLGGGRFRLPNGPELEFDSTRTSVRLLDDGTVTRFAAVPPPDTAASALAQYLGTYRSDELDVRITIALQDGGLVWRQPFGIERRLTPVFPGGFTTPLRGTTALVFSRAASGRVDGLGIWASAARDIRFVRE